MAPSSSLKHVTSQLSYNVVEAEVARAYDNPQSVYLFAFVKDQVMRVGPLCTCSKPVNEQGK